MLNSFFHRSELPDERRRSRSSSGSSIAGGDSPSSIDQPQQQPGLKPAGQTPPDAVEGSSDPADQQPDNGPAESGQRPVEGDRLRPEADGQDVQDFDETDYAEVDERDAEPSPDEAGNLPPWLGGPPKRRGRQLVKPSQDPGRRVLTPEQRLLVLDSWKRSGLPAGDFAALVGVSKHTLYSWKKRFDALGPAGLMDQPRGGPRGSKLPEVTKRTILMLKENNPEWGCQRISDMLQRGPALPASPTAVARVLKESGYQMEEVPTRPHPDKTRRFERAKPNQLWQTDLFTFVLKRQNRRVYMVAFMDDYSRYITGFGLYASQSAPLVLEVLRAALTNFGQPEEILTDNGAQYVTWRGKSQFTRELEKRGIRQIVAKPRRPQTLGKIERFWGTLWRECVETSVFRDLDDARVRIAHFIDHYNFSRTHSGIDGLVPADRYFGAAPEILETLKQRVAANSLDLARGNTPKPPFYVTGQLGGQAFSLHAEGERMILKRAGQDRSEVELVRPEDAPPQAPPPAPLCPDGSPSGSPAGPAPVPPGTSPLDGYLARLAAAENAAPAPQEPSSQQDEQGEEDPDAQESQEEQP